MGELVSSDTSDFEEDPEERQRTERAATAAVRRRNGPQVAFGAQARQQPGLGLGRGQPRQRRGQSGLRGGTRSQGRGTRGHPVGARQVGRAPQAVPTRRQLSVQYHVDDEDNRILNLSDDPPLNLVTDINTQSPRLSSRLSSRRGCKRRHRRTICCCSRLIPQ